MKGDFKNVAYLEDTDFDSNGMMVQNNMTKGKPVVVMIQAGWCPHCIHAKQAFQDFANKHREVLCATIQSDGDRESEKKLAKRIKDIKTDFAGFPDYMLIVNGKVANKNINGRSVNDLEALIM
jgi:thiol-disulfide isomerase/thioredoxin